MTADFVDSVQPLAFANGNIVMYQNEPYHIMGRCIDGTYTLGRRTVDGWEWHVDDVPEASLTPSNFVEHHKDGVYAGLIDADELTRINNGRANGTIIGHGQPNAAKFVVAVSDKGLAAL